MDMCIYLRVGLAPWDRVRCEMLEMLQLDVCLCHGVGVGAGAGAGAGVGAGCRSCKY
jgi:hypothetical protein